MKNCIRQLLLYFLIVLLLVMLGGCDRKPTLPDNCTCVTSKGKYSLFSLQSKDPGKPRFSVSGFPPHKGYTYTYNPCVPYDFTSSQGSCINVALCKYNTGGDPPDYINIGEQKEVQCDISRDGKIALVYQVHKYNPDIPEPESRVTLECNNDPQADPEFNLTNEASMTFNLKSYCGCINQCLPSPGPTKPGSTTPAPTGSTTPAPTGSATPSTGTKTPSPGPGGTSSFWDQLNILLPSILGALLVVVILFVCLWRRQLIVQRCWRCCPCHDQITDLPRVGVIVESTETSALISNQADNRAVEHDFLGPKDKLNEPVQEEDGDYKYKFPGKDDRIVVV